VIDPELIPRIERRGNLHAVTISSRAIDQPGDTTRAIEIRDVACASYVDVLVTLSRGYLRARRYVWDGRHSLPSIFWRGEELCWMQFGMHQNAITAQRAALALVLAKWRTGWRP